VNAEVLTWEEIERRYPNEWVLIAEPEIGTEDEVLAGTVVYHAEDRDRVGRQAIELRLRSGALLYTGELWDEEVGYLL
jgi:hypothetical protein